MVEETRDLQQNPEICYRGIPRQSSIHLLFSSKPADCAIFTSDGDQAWRWHCGFSWDSAPASGRDLDRAVTVTLLHRGAIA
jgi:hypothetical protein